MNEKQFKKKIINYRLSFIIIFGIFMFTVIMFSIVIKLQQNKTNNEAVMYCEMSNINADAGNKLIPYFEKYMDESIETVGEINSTLSNLLELSLVGKRGIKLPTLDCPIEDCDGPFAGPYDSGLCDIIMELKYGVKNKQ